MMVVSPAKAGNMGHPATLSNENLEMLNVLGSGQLCFQQEGNSVSFNWIPQADSVGVRERFDSHPGLAAQPPDRGHVSNPTAVNPVNLAWSAPGHLGKRGGRITGPIQFVFKLKDHWCVGEAEVIRLLGYDPEDPEDVECVSEVLDGRGVLRGRDIRDRITHLFCIRRTLWSLFQDQEVENEWLRERHSMLNEDSPLSLMLEGSMENLLLVREYVEFAAGIR